MLKKLLITAPRLGLFLLLLTASYDAQAQSADRMIVNVPFAFSAGDKWLPAGEYSVKRTSLASPGLTIQRTGGGPAAIVMRVSTLQAREGRPRAGLVLRRYEGGYFLEQVWLPGSDTGSRLRASRAARRLGRQAAADGGRAEQMMFLAARK